MKIKIITKVPVEEKHGITKDRIFDTIQDYESEGLWVMGGR